MGIQFGGGGAPQKQRAGAEVTFVGLLFWLALVPLPFGSDRPFFWYLNGSAVAFLALLWLANDKRGEALLDLQPTSAMAAGSMLVAVLWLIIQVLPVPSLLPSHPIWTRASDVLHVIITPRISVDPPATVAMAVRYLTYIFAFLLVARFSLDPHRRHRLLIFIFLVTCSQAVIGIVSLAGGDRIIFMEKWAYQGSATGTFVNRNSFATFLAFGLAVGAALMLDGLVEISKSRGSKPATFQALLRSPEMLICLYGLGQIVLGIALLLSGSRMGTVGGIVGLIIVFAISFSRPDARIYSMALLGVFGAVGAALLFLAGAELMRRFGWLDYSVDIRLLLFSQVLIMISARPLTGYGGGTFETAFPAFHQLPLNPAVTWDTAHNTYLELLADLGIVGITPILAMAVLAFGIFRGALTSPTRTAGISAIAVVGIGAAHSAVDFPLQIQANVILLLAIVACGLAESLTAQASSKIAYTRGLTQVEDHISGLPATRKAAWFRMGVIALLGGMLSVSLLGAWREAAPHVNQPVGLDERIESMLQTRGYITFPWESITARRTRLTACIGTLNDLRDAGDQRSLKLLELTRVCLRLVRELIVMAPMSANEWLVAGILASNLGEKSAALAYLEMSYATGPNEQWIARRRVPLARHLRAHLSSVLLDSFANDLRLLLIPPSAAEREQ